jgi:hypothetical protein
MLGIFVTCVFADSRTVEASKSPLRPDFPPWEYHPEDGNGEDAEFDHDNPPWGNPEPKDPNAGIQENDHDNADVGSAFGETSLLEILKLLILAIVGFAVLGFAIVLYRSVRAIAGRFPREADIDEPLIRRLP